MHGLGRAVFFVSLSLSGCSGWQRAEVSALVAKELQCTPGHAVVKGPVRPNPQDGITTLAPGEQAFRGACDLWWDERIVVTCRRDSRECTVVDVGPPRSPPETAAR